MTEAETRVIELDERGTRCPQPVIALGQAVSRNLGVPIRIVLLADDPATNSDVPAWCRMTEATLVDVSALPDGSGLRFEIIT